MPQNNRHRVCFDVDDETFERMKKLQWGFLAPVMRTLLERTIDAVEKNGQKMIGLIIDGRFDFIERP